MSNDSHEEEVTTKLIVDPRVKRASASFTVPTLRVVAGTDMLRFASVYPNERIIIGRDPAVCQLVLEDASISRRHAAIEHGSDGQLTLTDLGSTNGTRHNGIPVTGSTDTRIGDNLDLGTVSLRIDRMNLDELAHLSRVVDRLTRANKDPLTGLVTRAFVEEDLPLLISRHHATSLPLSLVFADIDHFKQVNDKRGHTTGDEVLRAVGRLMAFTVRDADTCVRYGGEEFLIVLPGSKMGGAAIMAERLRAQVANHDWDHYSAGLSVTLSLGIAELKSDSTPRSLLEEADAALYRAKMNGRNRVVCAD